jgi:hypothetical protein
MSNGFASNIKKVLDSLSDKDISDACRNELKAEIGGYLKKLSSYIKIGNSTKNRKDSFEIAMSFLCNPKPIKYNVFIGIIYAISQSTSSSIISLRNRDFNDIIDKIFSILFTHEASNAFLAKKRFDSSNKNNPFNSKSTLRIMNQSSTLNDGLKILYKNFTNILKENRLYKIRKLVLLLSFENKSFIVPNSCSILYNNILITLDAKFCNKPITIFHDENKGIISVYYEYKIIHFQNYKPQVLQGSKFVISSLAYVLGPLLTSILLEPVKELSDEEIIASFLSSFFVEKFLSKLAESSQSNLLSNIYEIIDKLDDDILLNSENLISFITFSLGSSFNNAHLIPVMHWLCSFDTREDGFANKSKTAKRYAENNKLSSNLVETLKEVFDILLSCIGTNYYEFLNTLVEQKSNDAEHPIAKLAFKIASSPLAQNVAVKTYDAIKAASPVLLPVTIGTIDAVYTAYKDLYPVFKAVMGVFSWLNSFPKESLYSNEVILRKRKSQFFDAIDSVEGIKEFEQKRFGVLISEHNEVIPRKKILYDPEINLKRRGMIEHTAEAPVLRRHDSIFYDAVEDIKDIEELESRRYGTFKGTNSLRFDEYRKSYLT